MADEVNISPRTNSFLLGQTKAEELFLKAWKNNTMHHAWILSGPKGIGKATLAYRIARFLLWADESKKESYNSLNIPEDSEVFKQTASGSHPDLMVVERDYIETDRKKIIKAIQKGEAPDEEELSAMKKSAFIRVDDVRKVNEFLAKTSFNDNWRIVIIDSADEMNKNAANALLKILEEPPAHTVLLLISHNAGMLLSTIRSRCAKLPLQMLDFNETASLLRRYRPQLKEAMISKVAEMCSQSIGQAILYADLDAVGMYDNLCKILYLKQKFALSDLLEFCTEATADADSFALLQELILKFIRENMLQSQDVEALYACWDETNRKFADCQNINMDKKQMLINLITKICKVL